ncbi:ankyrin repeat and MYND domain-containing protein 1-like [Ursus americanus]|uniref:ankyrin repeat and MYND domain-containing protein 1-like n=1 Tax=Ursus americanus TaxID=9643 RepID=UPI001E67A7CC|nr:ankyrin repeat and MYND domain-containing protein 1-like [Ursus americanus]
MCGKWPGVAATVQKPYSGHFLRMRGEGLVGADKLLLVQIVKELLSHGADPNLLLTKGLGSALCVACDLTYEHQRSTDSKLALIDRLINYGADILNPVTLTQGDKVAVGTAVDYGYFKFYQDRKIAHCPFHTLTPAEREVFLARKRLLEYMGFQLRRAVFAKESQWDPKLLTLSKRVELTPYQRLKRRSTSPSKALHVGEQELPLLSQWVYCPGPLHPSRPLHHRALPGIMALHPPCSSRTVSLHKREPYRPRGHPGRCRPRKPWIPFFKFCSQCGRSVGVRLVPCTRCYGVLTCSKYCKTRAWGDFHKRDCGTLSVTGKMDSALFTQNFRKSSKHLGKKASQKPDTPELPGRPKRSSSTYNQE